MNTEQSQLLRWVLVETSHPGNVGSAARALKTMGFGDLRLIKPKMQNVAKEPEAIALASGAIDILQSSQESDSLPLAVQGCSLVLGLTSRDREFGPPALDWESARSLIQATTANHGQVALVFGPERTGLDNDHLALCTHKGLARGQSQLPFPQPGPSPHGLRLYAQRDSQESLRRARIDDKS